MTAEPESVPTIIQRPPQTRAEAIAAAGLAPDAPVVVVTVLDCRKPREEPPHDVSR
jgi:hypothetical protein